MNLNTHVIVALASCCFLTGIREHNVATELKPLQKDNRRSFKHNHKSKSIGSRRRNK
jgi:hypothetical protein